MTIVTAHPRAGDPVLPADLRVLPRSTERGQRERRRRQCASRGETATATAGRSDAARAFSVPAAAPVGPHEDREHRARRKPQRGRIFAAAGSIISAAAIALTLVLIEADNKTTPSPGPPPSSSQPGAALAAVVGLPSGCVAGPGNGAR
jgi:hypothetical protein